jgi:hypothetical protein
MEEMFSRGWDELMARDSGPLHFRLILQPLVAGMEEISLDEVPAGYERLHRGEVAGRVVALKRARIARTRLSIRLTASGKPQDAILALPAVSLHSTTATQSTVRRVWLGQKWPKM